MEIFSFGFITAALAGSDLWCKHYVEDNIRKGEGRAILKGRVSLRKVHNKGMAFNLGDKYPKTVRILSGIVCGIVSIYSIVVWAKEQCLWKMLGVALILAGAVSNTYDRFVRKYVVDYFGFKTKWEKFNQITFNLADVFLIWGSVILVVVELLGKKK